MIVGAWRWPQYEHAFAQGLRENGVKVIALSMADFFSGRLGRIQQLTPVPGFAMIRFNRAVVIWSKSHQPEFVIFWRPTHILPVTIKRLAQMGIRTVSYNNDDPFGPKAHGNVPLHHHALWYWYIKCLKHFDLNFFYRDINCEEAMVNGAKHAALLLPYFIPWQDRPVQLGKDERELYETDVVFVGHYEADGREESLRALVLAGFKVKLWGGHYWTSTVLGDIYDNLAPIVMAEGNRYGKALSGAKVCLCFLSKLNRDTYTRRCFEIPAYGKVMLAERTDDLMCLFKEDEEACFFSNNDELVHKVQWLLNNPDVRERIAEAGLRRVWADGHDVGCRVKSFINVLAGQLT